MKSLKCILGFSRVLLIVISMLAVAPARALDFTLPALTTGDNKYDLGVFNSGDIFVLSFTGQVSLLPDWDVYADGSIVHAITNYPGYEYANPGVTGYPIDFGGDGINHFSNGGINYDSALGGVAGFGLAGEMTTDTTNTNTIRFGSVVGTFNSNPTRDDWFFIGLSKVIVVPSNATHLYLAVHDSTYPNNSGEYNGRLTYPSPPILDVHTYAGLVIQGTVGVHYRIEYTGIVPSTNWTTLTNFVLPSSPYLFFDTSVPAAGQRFYRATAIP